MGSWFSPVEQDNGFTFSDKAVQIADLNGDRVPDIGWIRPAGVLFTPGLGYGRFGSLSNLALVDVDGADCGALDLLAFFEST